MVEKKLYVNPTLYITESKDWTYFTVDKNIYKVKLSEQELKDIYETIQKINQEHTRKACEEERLKKAFRMLEALGCVMERTDEKKRDETLLICSVKHIANIEALNQYCRNECLRFSETEEGLFAYLTDKEVVLSKRELHTGNFRRPNEKMQELFVQTVLKNEQEILDAMAEHNCLAISLFRYSSGVRILEEEISGKDEESSYLPFQPWNTSIIIDGESSYPLMLVKCVIDHLPFEAAGMDTNNALYQIYLEHKSMKGEGYV